MKGRRLLKPHLAVWNQEPKEPNTVPALQGSNTLGGYYVGIYGGYIGFSDITRILENQTENEMETWFTQGCIWISNHLTVLDSRWKCGVGYLKMTSE